MSQYEYPYPVSTDKKKALVVFSGGQDSTTCLYWALEHFDEVHALSFNYGQKHERELQAAIKIIGECHAHVTHEVLHVGPVLKGTSPLINPEETLEQYDDAESLPGGLEKTFVPMRNQLFLTLAANRAYCIGARNLVTGICQADSGGYPDCREDFANSLQLTTNLGTFTGEPGTVGNIKIHTPLMHLTKAESIELAIDVGAYGPLMWSHTAYDGNYPPTGNDHANLLRESGFTEIGLPDPLVVRAVTEGLMNLPERPGYHYDNTAKCVGGTEADLLAMLEDIADQHVLKRSQA